MALTTPKITAFLGGSAPTFNTWFIWSTRVFIKNGISISLAVFCTSHRRVSHYFTMGRYVFTPKLLIPFGGSGPPCNTWYLGPIRVIIPNGIALGSAAFCMGPEYYAVQCIVNGEENPQNGPVPWDFITLPEEGRTTAIGSMHKIGKDRVCGSGNMLAERETDRQPDTDVVITILRNSSRWRSNKLQ